MTHSPGPWMYLEKENRSGVYRVKVKDVNGKPVMEIAIVPSMNGMHVWKNLLLAMASPLLYDMVEKLIPLAETFDQSADRADQIAEAKSLLAEVRGEETGEKIDGE